MPLVPWIPSVMGRSTVGREPEHEPLKRGSHPKVGDPLSHMQGKKQIKAIHFIMGMVSDTHLSVRLK